jgi:hypothetical protein
MSTGTFHVTVGSLQPTARGRAPAPGNVWCAKGGSPKAKTSVLVIEEDQTMAEVLTAALRHEGYSVSRVRSPDDAVALLAARGPGAFELVVSSPFWRPCEERDRYAWLPSVIMARYPRLARGTM